MSDKSSSFADLVGDSDEELVFDDVAPAAPVVTIPAPEETAAKKPAPAARRGRSPAREKPADDLDIIFDAVSSSLETASASVAPVAAPEEEPAGSDPAPDPLTPGIGLAGSPMPKGLIALLTLALLTSLMSLGGLITVARIVSRATADRDTAAEQRAMLERAPAIVARLDAASRRLEEAAARAMAASPSGPPASIADVRRELDALRLQIAQRQPQGLDALNGTTRDGFSELNTKIEQITRALDRPGRTTSTGGQSSRQDYRSTGSEDGRRPD